MEIKDNILHRPDTCNRYDDMPSVGHLMVKSLTKAGDRTMLIDGLTGETLSAAELVNKSIAMAKGLLAAGIKQGDAVSIVSENRLEFPCVVFGTIFNNCIMAPINNTYTEREITHALDLSKPKIIFVSKTSSKRVIDIAKSLTFVKKVVLLDNDTSNDNIAMKLRDFMDSERLANVHFEPRAVDKVKTCCFVMCSSGTTGLPKGVQISQEGIIVATRLLENWMLNGANCGTSERVILGLLPLFHVFGSGVMTCSMAAALGKIVLLPKFEEKTFLKTIQDYRCTVAFLVPPLLVFLAKNENVDKYDLSSLRYIMSGAAPLSRTMEQSVMDRLRNPHLVLKQSYGMTELSFCIAVQKELVKPGSIGDINPGVLSKVVDENGKTLGPFEPGELCFKGSSVMMGYINDKAATSATIDEDGWLHSGDVGYYDQDLQYFIVDRIKELIKWKAYQVPPAG